MDVAITKMSSKGQVVIPAEMRTELNEGDKFIVFRNKDQIIMKQANKLDTNFKEDIEFAQKTEEAWKRILEGKGIEMDSDDFLEALEKW
jgi:AbrB family looped-hinge helix DNA binding protein